MSPKRGFSTIAFAFCAAGLVLGAPGPVAASVCDQDCRPVIERLPGGQDCYYVSATFDHGTKQKAVELSRQALQETVERWRRGQGPDSAWRSRRVSLQAAAPRPNPYLRAGVSSELLLKPDIRTRDAHTVCWRGVVSPAVCTSAARMCR